MLSRLNDGAAQAFCLRERLGHVLDGDEEQHLVLGALPRADRDVGAVLGACVDEGVTGEGAFGGHLPAEQVGEELTRRIGVGGANLGVDRRGGSWQVSSIGYGSEAGVG